MCISSNIIKLSIDNLCKKKNVYFFDQLFIYFVLIDTFTIDINIYYRHSIPW